MCLNGAAAETALTPSPSSRSSGCAKPRKTAAPGQSSSRSLESCAGAKRSRVLVDLYALRCGSCASGTHQPWICVESRIGR
jgi:hypothetical protein